jgi:glycosyltransferase involved in cell wall biosynthesis
LQKNLLLIYQNLYFPYSLKFHLRSVYNLLIRKQIRDILRVIGKPPDLIWSFDLGNSFPLRLFSAPVFKVFHPVDEPGDRYALQSCETADLLLSVTHEIIGKYASYGIPSFFINHGLADEFLERRDYSGNSNQLQVGISGNFLRPDLDRKTLLEIAALNPDILFNFYGSFAASHSNIGAADDEPAIRFIRDLQELKNVKFHGVLKTEALSAALNRMDILLICYDMDLDQSKGTNYHKVMEYLSTGKVIVSNNITTYKEYPEMIRMVPERDNNRNLPVLFKDTVDHLEKFNSAELMNKRRTFAENNSYKNQLERIEQIIDGLQISDFKNKNIRQ